MSAVTEEKSLLDYLILAWQILAAIGAVLLLTESVIICIRKPWCLLASLILGGKLIIIDIIAPTTILSTFIPISILGVFIMMYYFSGNYRYDYLKANNLPTDTFYTPWYIQLTSVFGCSFVIWLTAAIFNETSTMQYIYSILKMFM